MLNIFTLCSLYRSRLPPSPTRIRESYMASCSGPPLRPCSPSPLIPSTWAPRSAFLPCSILGALTCFIIPTYTVWSPAVVSLSMAPNGFPAGVDFSFPSSCSQGFFFVFSWHIWSNPFTRPTHPFSPPPHHSAPPPHSPLLFT